jgi:hypothetical protein
MPFILNYELISKSREMPSYVKDIAIKVGKSGGMTVGSWLRQVSTPDLIVAYKSGGYLHEIQAELLTSNGQPSEGSFSLDDALLGKTFLTLTDVLSVGEGLSLALDPVSTQVRVITLRTFISIEMLNRRGVKTELDYNSISLSEDTTDASAALIKNAVDKSSVEIASMLKIPVEAFRDLLTAKLDKSDDTPPPKQEAPDPPKKSLWGSVENVLRFISSYRKGKP